MSVICILLKKIKDKTDLDINNNFVICIRYIKQNNKRAEFKCNNFANLKCEILYASRHNRFVSSIIPNNKLQHITALLSSKELLMGLKRDSSVI